MKQYEIVNIKLTDIDPNEWNPNIQDNKTFEMLVEELDQDDGDHVYLTVTEDQFYEVEKFFDAINLAVDEAMLSYDVEPGGKYVDNESKIRAEVTAFLMIEVFKKNVFEGFDEFMSHGVKQMVAQWISKQKA